jgi:hypothetical protein
MVVGEAMLRVGASVRSRNADSAMLVERARG